MKSEGNVGIADNDLIRDNSCYSNHQPINVMDNGNLLTNTDINKLECTPKMTGILKEFTELYTEKLQRIAETEGEEEMKRKVSVLECWVNDLGEQNSILVSTVEELEREASRRVSLLQEKLDQMALTTRESCLSLRDHQLQVSSMLDQKITAEEEVKSLREKVLMVQQTHSSLLQENSDLRQDFNTLLEVISRGRSTGRWYCDDVTFNSIKPDQIAGLEPSHGFRSSSPKSSEDSRKPCPSPLLADDESSVGILKTEVLNLKQFVTEKNLVISQRDQHIADLQCQLTELHHKLAAAHSQVDNTTSTLHSLMDRGRHDSFEISRRDDVIRQLLSPTRHSKEIEEEDSRPKLDVEHELSDNIDVMALRLADLEEECQELRHRNSSLEASHSRCDQLRDELTDSQNAAQEMKLRLRECTNQCQHLTKELQTKETLIESLKKELEKKVSSEERKLVNFQHHSEDMESKATQTEKMALDERQISRQKIDQAKFYKLENELSEKNIVIRELQNHLVVSREELRLKDETLYNVEQKLDASRRGYDEKEERMLYLTSQLTNLQLEVSRLHGNLQQIRMQLENKCELVMKLESENRSLTRHHNEKTSSFEVMRGQVTRLAAEGERKTKEIADQKITIGSLQEALVEAKSSCEKMKSQFDSQSGPNLTSKISLASFLQPDRTGSVPLKPDSCKDLASHLSTVRPDLRPLSTSIPPPGPNCPDVVAFLNQENVLSDNVLNKVPNGSSLTGHHSIPRPLTLNLNMQSQGSSLSLNMESTEPSSLNLSSFPSLYSLDRSFDTDTKSLTVLSPSDSGIGDEQDRTYLGAGSPRINTAKNATFGKVFQI